MAAMHEDSSPELTEVARIFEDILEVNMKANFFPFMRLFIVLKCGICVTTMFSLITFFFFLVDSFFLSDHRYTFKGSKARSENMRHCDT